MRGLLRLGLRHPRVRWSSSSAAAPAVDLDKYAERLAQFAERVGKPPVRLQGIRYDGTVKRFYKGVDVEETPDGFAPTVGGRFLQTAGGFIVEVPSRMLANSIALEWDCQKNVIKPHLMPLMHLATQTLDQISVKREHMLNTVLAYVDFDSACVRDYEAPALGRAQEKYLDPVVAWAEERFKTKINVTKPDANFLEKITQSPQTAKAIEVCLANLTDWEYAVFEQCCQVSKSILVSIAIMEGQLDLTRAFECARLEENYSMRKNGILKGAFGHGIDVEFVKTRLAAARTFINMINHDPSPPTVLRKRNSLRNPPPVPQGKTLTKLLKDAQNDDPF